MLAKFNSLFPVWAILCGILAFISPDTFTPYKFAITPLLTLIMLFMGITLSWADFARVFSRPVIILLTVCLQFLLMPLFALGIAKLFGFPTDLLVGMVLVGVVSGGTASNVMTYLAKGDVALSISMTMVSTIASIIVTPFLIDLYLGSQVTVDVKSIMMGLVRIVFLPIILGMIGHAFLRERVQRMSDILTTLSMVSIISIITIIVADNQGDIAKVGGLVFLGVILHNLLGLASGYSITKLLGYDETICRTVAIEVGMQNSGLAASLGTTYFSKLSALPGAIFSVWHNVSGAILASYWSRRSK